MLEHYFIRPTTIDRIRGAWLGEPIELYVTWLHNNHYAARNVHARVPLLIHFGEFAQSHGATNWEQLPEHVDSFVTDWVGDHSSWCCNATDKRRVENSARTPIKQLLQLILPEEVHSPHDTSPDPFKESAPDFFPYLYQERGLQETTISHYRRFLRQFEQYLYSISLSELRSLSNPVVSSFITQCGRRMCKNSLRYPVGVLRVFLGYLYREKIISQDLGKCIEAPQQYRLSHVPRSISWDEVKQLLAVIDQRSAVGKRDYAIVLLMITYGLRAREIAALTLESIDWERERLLVNERKGGHASAYPLSSSVGDAIIAYLRGGRPETEARNLFFCAMAPERPLRWYSVSQCVARYLRKAGIDVSRPGAHTLRHTCVQRLVDAEFALKNIGDYVGHRSPDATEIYTKVAIETLRRVALGDGEDII